MLKSSIDIRSSINCTFELNIMNRYLRLAAISLVVLSGCSTYKNYSPSINEASRSGLSLRKPVIVSVFDGRGNREGGQKPAQDIQSGIQKAYPEAVTFSDYFSPTPSGRVRIKIRVQELGSQFGSRLVSGVAIANQYGKASALATDGWNTVVASAQSQQTTFGSAMAAEGWWIGTAWLEVTVEDRRTNKTISFTFPIVSEHRETNMLGYASAKAATKRAWSTASAHLFSTIDNVLLKVRDQ
jgi:hypothetical protein